MKLKEHFKYRPFKSKDVLLVDDEGELGWIMKKIIGEAGHRFIYATTAKEGMEKFRRSKNLDMAIIDLRLDNRDGLTFIRRAKAVNDKVKFVMISAFGTVEAKKRARHLGVRHFLDKPIKIERLLDIINRDCI